jgi:hypothetical protein
VRQIENIELAPSVKYRTLMELQAIRRFAALSLHDERSTRDLQRRNRGAASRSRNA